jgi:hypothetical protein
MKTQLQELIYHNLKTKQSTLVGKKFLYEVCVNLHYKNYYSQIKKEYYESLVPINNFVESIFINRNVEITCELHTAPIEWLEDNNFIIWTKPEKKKRCKNVSKK